MGSIIKGESDFVTNLTAATDGELAQFAFHIGARRVVALVVAEGVVLVVDDFAVGVVVAREAQLAKVLRPERKRSGQDNPSTIGSCSVDLFLSHLLKYKKCFSFSLILFKIYMKENWLTRRTIPKDRLVYI